MCIRDRHIGGHYEAQELAPEEELSLQGETIPADTNVKNFSYAVVDGDVYFRENSIMRKADLSATATGRIKGMVELRTIVQELIDYQLNDYPEDAIAQKQRELNIAYDRFADQYGFINSRGLFDNTYTAGTDNQEHSRQYQHVYFRSDTTRTGKYLQYDAS